MILTYGQNIYTSSDGFTWLQKTLPLPLNVPSGVSFGQSSFFLVGALGAVFESDPLLALSMSFTSHAQLQLSGPIGRSCRIEAADSLGSAISWSPLGTVLLTNAPQAWTDLRVPGARSFYRAVLVP